jgi:hypothetical protein
VKSIFVAMGWPRNAPVCAEAPVNTAASPYRCTCVSNNIIEASLRSPDLSAARTPALSQRLPLSSGLHTNRRGSCRVSSRRFLPTWQPICAGGPTSAAPHRQIALLLDASLEIVFALRGLTWAGAAIAAAGFVVSFYAAPLITHWTTTLLGSGAPIVLNRSRVRGIVSAPAGG